MSFPADDWATGDISKTGALALAGIGVLALLQAALLWWTTPHGIGVRIDSLTYWTMADDLRAGTTISSPHFPPFFPAVLAAIPGVALENARALNAVASAGIVLLGGVAVWRETRNPAASLLAAVALLAIRTLDRVSVYAWSEPLAILLLIAGLTLSAIGLEENAMWRMVAGALLVGLAAATRYAFAMAPAALIWMAWRHAGSRRKRDATLLGSIAALPLAAWLVRNVLVAGALTGRQWGWQPIANAEWLKGARTLRRLVLPNESAPVWLDCILGVLVLSAIVALCIRAVRGRRAIPAVIGACVLLYLPFLALSISAFDHATPLDVRILSPVLLFSVPLAAMESVRHAITRRTTVIVGAVVFLLGHFAMTVRWQASVRTARIVGPGSTVAPELASRLQRAGSGRE